MHNEMKQTFNMASWRGLDIKCVILWILLCFIYGHMGGTQGFPPEEYCRYDKFRARCQGNQVVFMETAVFGRMQVGKCIKQDYVYGVINCSVDALAYLHSLCSGKHNCITPDVITYGKEIRLDCLADLAPYLEAGYTCTAVTPVGRDCVISALSTASTSQLANADIESHGCGTDANPIIVEAQPMQRINISMVDFGYYTSSNKPLETGEGGCLQYGVIRERNNMGDMTICGGQAKHSHLYVSRGNRLEIRILSPSKVFNKHFLLGIDVLGCPEPEIPSSMWVKRAGDHILVGCYTSRATWRLECHNEAWQGDIGNCSVTHKKKNIIINKEEEILAMDADVQEVDMVAFSNEIGIAAAVVSSVFISILLLVIGLLYDRRRSGNQGNGHVHLVVNGDFNNHTQERLGLDTLKKLHPKAEGGTLTPSSGSTKDTSQRTSEWCQSQRPPSHVDHIYDTPSYFDLDPDYVAQGNNTQFGTMANRDSYLQPGDDKQLGHNFSTLGNRDSYLQPAENGNASLPL